jgi:hypothetical protein
MPLNSTQRRTAHEAIKNLVEFVLASDVNADEHAMRLLRECISPNAGGIAPLDPPTVLAALGASPELYAGDAHMHHFFTI